MVDNEQYVGTAFVLLAYLAEKSKKEGRQTFTVAEITEDFKKIKKYCPDTHLLNPDLHLPVCLDILNNPTNLVEYSSETVSICQMGIAFGERKRIPGNCRRYISREWGN